MNMDSLPHGSVLAVLALVFLGLGFFIGRTSRKVGVKTDRDAPLQSPNEIAANETDPSNSRPILLSGIKALDTITVNDILIPRSEVEV